MPYASRPKPSIEEKRLAKVENLSLSRRVALENKVNKSLEKVMTLVMKKYHNFSGELQSDIALSAIVCARILAGINSDITSCIYLLQNLNFVYWSKTSINAHLQKISSGLLQKMI